MTCQQRPSVRTPSDYGGRLMTPCIDLRKHFQEIARKHSPEPREVHAFLTTAIVRPVFLFNFPSLNVVLFCAGHTCYDQDSCNNSRANRRREPSRCEACLVIINAIVFEKTTNIILSFSCLSCFPHYDLLCHIATPRKRISLFGIIDVFI